MSSLIPASREAYLLLSPQPAPSQLQCVTRNLNQEEKDGEEKKEIDGSLSHDEASREKVLTIWMNDGALQPLVILLLQFLLLMVFGIHSDLYL